MVQFGGYRKQETCATFWWKPVAWILEPKGKKCGRVGKVSRRVENCFSMTGEAKKEPNRGGAAAEDADETVTGYKARRARAKNFRPKG